MSPDILLFLIKLVTGGIVAFLAIFLMSKTRDGAWMAIVCGFLLSYASMVFELLVSLGVLSHTSLLIFGIPLSTLICTILPSLCFMIGFILMLCKKE